MTYDEMEQAGPYMRRFYAEGENRWYYYHKCPACDDVHQYAVGLNLNGFGWAFNDNVDSPTFSPSMLISQSTLEEVDFQTVRETKIICHYFIIEGQISYCSDSPHIFAGKIYPLPMWPKIK